jgi:hypothetical protein
MESAAAEEAAAKAWCCFSGVRATAIDIGEGADGCGEGAADSRAGASEDRE